jgi:hypothetical protein
MREKIFGKINLKVTALKNTKCQSVERTLYETLSGLKPPGLSLASI